jgi:hypothetical protein
MNPAFGRGFGGRGPGGGRGWRNWLYATGLTGWQRAFGWPFAGVPQTSAAPVRDQELAALKAQAEHFESALGDIRKRIEDLETTKQG